jgi:hypothetical protein
MRFAAWMLRKPIGGSTASISTGTRTPRSSPSFASSRTQREVIEAFDHSTRTQSDFLISDSMTPAKVLPACSLWSHHTAHPRASRSAAISRARSRSSLA